MRVIRIVIVFALGSAFTAAGPLAACSNFSEASDPAPDASSPTIDSGAGGEDAAVEGASQPDAQPDGARAPVGCSDGTREGYPDAPQIAACAGAWSTAGLIAPAGAYVPTTCSRQAGNDGARPTGDGCSAGDLCATGWHVCRGRVDVTRALPAGDDEGPCELPRDSEGELFYATAQPSGGSAACDTEDGGTNDVIGCGDLPTQPATSSCSPLNALLGTDHPVAGWLVSGASNERATVLHLNPTGGVLCCADP